MQFSLSASATSNCSLQSISCKKSMGGSDMINHPMQKSPASSYGELNSSLITKQYSIAEAQGDGNSCKQASSLSTSSSSTHSNNILNEMLEENPNPKTNLKTSPIHNPNPKNLYCEVLEEGQGECDGDHVSSVNGSPAMWDNSMDTTLGKRRRPSPTAVSCFCKDIEEEQEYFQQVLGSSSYGWTDEKHSSYLDSMVVDFLRSIVFRGNVHTESSSDLHDSASSHQAKASKEFKVYQNGRWRPTCGKAPYVNIGPLKQVAVAVKNPWIKRLRASKKAYFPSLSMEDPLFEGFLSS